mgnify:CR=1 FL=1
MKRDYRIPEEKILPVIFIWNTVVFSHSVCQSGLQGMGNYSWMFLVEALQRHDVFIFFSFSVRAHSLVDASSERNLCLTRWHCA